MPIIKDVIDFRNEVDEEFKRIIADASSQYNEYEDAIVTYDSLNAAYEASGKQSHDKEMQDKILRGIMNEALNYQLKKAHEMKKVLEAVDSNLDRLCRRPKDLPSVFYLAEGFKEWPDQITKLSIDSRLLMNRKIEANDDIVKMAKKWLDFRENHEVAKSMNYLERYDEINGRLNEIKKEIKKYEDEMDGISSMLNKLERYPVAIKKKSRLRQAELEGLIDIAKSKADDIIKERDELDRELEGLL